MFTVFHRFKHPVLICGNVAGIAAAMLLAAGVASAATPVRNPGTTRPPVLAAPPTAVALEAFPAGGKGSGSEKTCGLYTGLLQADQYGIEGAENANDQAALDKANAALEKDINSALDAGCAVID
jgi:hypothetical protein